jgi:hypothetical protein
MADDVAFLGRFKGLFDTGLSTPHPQGLADIIACIQPPAAGDEIRFKNREYVIRDEENYLWFISRIPKRVMDFVPSPGPSNDPLLHIPRIDFTTQMMLVIISHEPNRLVDLDITGVELTPKAMRVLCRYSDPGRAQQKIIGVGTYCAVLVRRFDGEVIFHSVG